MAEQQNISQNKRSEHNPVATEHGESSSTQQSLMPPPFQLKSEGDSLENTETSTTSPLFSAGSIAPPNDLPFNSDQSSNKPVVSQYKQAISPFQTPIQQKSKSGGMPEDVRGKMENTFQTDFSNVNIHQNSQSATDVGALAYTQGNDIHFAPGQFKPNTTTGQELIGHELTHVVQQQAGRVKPTTQAGGMPVNDDRRLEAEADMMGRKAANSKASSPSQFKKSSSNSTSTSQFKIIQRYGSTEHSDLGDAGSGFTEYDVETPGPYKFPFKLTHGDLVMLSGDYFDPRDTLENGDPNPDSLFLLMDRPSLNIGQDVGTRDEIIYAIWTIKPKDARFQEGGIWEELNGEDKYSEAVTKAHDNRYLRLAANNIEHFVSPEGHEAGPDSGMHNSAGGSYRALHEAAILEAYKAGEAGTSVQRAKMREGAAQHYLTDYFAAGHTRTPRISIRKYWGAKYPLFWANLKKKIALDVAQYINDHDRVGYVASVTDIYNNVYSTILEKTKEMPAIGFDDLVSMVAHDLDNKTGLMVQNDIGMRWRTYGDSNLHQSQLTENIAARAVTLGIQDIKNAFAKGQAVVSCGSSSDEEILAQVRKEGQQLSNGKYAPEQLVPHLIEEENGAQNWKAPDFESLWRVKVRDDDEKTYGDLIKESLQKKDGELNHQMSGMAEKFPESKEVEGIFTVHPQIGFIENFFKPLKADPFNGLKSIIDFNPSEGQASVNEDDAVMEEINGIEKTEDDPGRPGMTDEELAGMTLNQRATRIENLLDGWTGEAEGDTIVKMFETCPVGDRARLYRLIEGHDWEGDFKQGVLTWDDDLYDDLTYSQLTTLKNLINEGT